MSTKQVRFEAIVSEDYDTFGVFIRQESLKLKGWRKAKEDDGKITYRTKETYPIEVDKPNEVDVFLTGRPDKELTIALYAIYILNDKKVRQSIIKKSNPLKKPKGQFAKSGIASLIVRGDA